MVWLEIMKFANNYFIFILLIFNLPANSIAKFKNNFQGEKFGIYLSNIDSKYLEFEANQTFIHRFHIKNPVSIDFTNEFKGTQCLINKKINCKSSFSYKIKQIDLASPLLEISFLNNRKKTEIILNLIPKNFPEIEIKGQSHIQTDFIFSWTPKKVNSPTEKDYSYLFIFSATGQLKYFELLPFTAFDFRPHSIDGKTYFSYLKSTGIYPLVTIEGTRFILDSNLDFVREFNEILDFHDFHLIKKDWYIGLTYEISKNLFGTKYIEQKIIERKNGKVIFEWSINEFMKLNPFPNWKMKSNYKGEFVVHQFHLNHIQVLGEQLLISLGFDSIFLLDKKTKKIIWLFGGGSDQFGVSDELFTSLHHTPFFDQKNSTLTVFDNGISKKNTRIIKYTLDIKNKKLIQFNQVAIPASFSAMMGSVVVIDNNYTIGFGTRDFGDFDILELQNNKITMSFKFRNVWSSTYKIYRSKVLN